MLCGMMGPMGYHRVLLSTCPDEVRSRLSSLPCVCLPAACSHLRSKSTNGVIAPTAASAHAGANTAVGEHGRVIALSAVSAHAQALPGSA